MIGRLFFVLLIVGLWFQADAQNISTRVLVVQKPGDVDATLAVNTTSAVTTTLTATRTWALPAASVIPAGATITVTDVAGVVATPGNNIVVDGNGTDTINGALTYSVTEPYGSTTFTSNGVNGWAASAQASGKPAAANFMPLSPTGTMFGPLALMKMVPAPPTAPGAGFAYIYLGKGTANFTCRLFMMAGTSTTPLDLSGADVGGNC